MLVREIYEQIDEKQIWARSGKKVVRKYRCTAGRRKGRIVKQMAQCFAAPDGMLRQDKLGRTAVSPVHGGSGWPQLQSG